MSSTVFPNDKYLHVLRLSIFIPRFPLLFVTVGLEFIFQYPHGDLKTPRVLQGHGNERRPISSKRAKVPSLVLNKQY